MDDREPVNDGGEAIPDPLVDSRSTRIFRLICLWLGLSMFYYPSLGFRPDRLALLGLLILVPAAWRNGSLRSVRLGGLGKAMVAFTLACFLSLIVAGSNRSSGYGANTELNEVFNLTVYPFLTYLVVRKIPYSRDRLLWFLRAMAVVGTYLGITGILERFDVNALIWPRYIADSGYGIHFGRSRGPFVQSVFMGFSLTVCLWAIYLLVTCVKGLAQRMALVVIALAIIGSVYFTNTRGAWMCLGLGLGLVSVLPTSMRKLSIRINIILVLGFLFSGASQFSLSGGNLFTKRQNTLEQRDLNYRIAFHMGLDHPLTGVGFSRMGDFFDNYFDKHYKGEEWQGWDGNHNEYLGLFAEVGVLAPFLYIYILFTLGRQAFSAFREFPPGMRLERGLAVCCLAMLLGFSLISYFNEVRAAPFHICIVYLFQGQLAAALDRYREEGEEAFGEVIDEELEPAEAVYG